MRIWDLPPRILCRQHLLGEHRELHAIWVVITRRKKGYAHHPETMRWRGKLRALYRRHDALVTEMARRSYQHHSNLNSRFACGAAKQTEFINPIREQLEILRTKQCDCKVCPRRKS